MYDDKLTKRLEELEKKIQAYEKSINATIALMANPDKNKSVKNVSKKDLFSPDADQEKSILY